MSKLLFMVLACFLISSSFKTAIVSASEFEYASSDPIQVLDKEKGVLYLININSENSKLELVAISLTKGIYEHRELSKGTVIDPTMQEIALAIEKTVSDKDDAFFKEIMHYMKNK